MRKTKKQRKYEKRNKLRNKKLVKKYPWLKPIKWASRSLKEIRDPHFDYSLLPIFTDQKGWWRAFGELLCDEIQALFHKNPDLYVLDYKEKWGGLRMDFGGADKEIYDIADKYETLSQNICWFCGKPDTPLTDTGWILPVCKECYEKQEWGNIPYEKVCLDDGKMREEIRWKYMDGREEVIDISATADKIRRKWNGR